MSVKYVSGDNDAIATPHCGRASIGMNIPLIKMSGNFTSVDSIMTFDTRSVGIVENRSPREEKENAPMTIAILRMTGALTQTPNARPMMTGTIEMTSPNKNDASISPSIIVLTVRGHETSLSSVFICVSHGAITGDTEVEVKNRVIAISPGIRNSGDSFLSIQNAKNRNSGNKIPNITTGPFR